MQETKRNDTGRKVVSLFSGAMGMDLGLTSAGLLTAVAQDIDPWCCETIRTNKPDCAVVCGDIKELIAREPDCTFLLKAAGLRKGEAFAVVGGPPCQAYSTAGRRRGTEDVRGTLYADYIHVVSSLRPRFFVMENVKGLLSMRTRQGDPDSAPLLDAILSEFASLGYKTVHGVLDAVDYGAPQFRERVIIVGSRDGEGVFLPAPTHFQTHQRASCRWRTLGDTIADLEGRAGPAAKFSPRIRKVLRMVPPGGYWKNLPEEVAKEAMGGAFASSGGKVGFFRRLDFASPSPTLVTSPVQKATMLCHPNRTRALSVKEYARIQGFPDDWELRGSVSDCYRQIGNAVPVQLSAAIGEMLCSVADGTASVRHRRKGSRAKRA